MRKKGEWVATLFGMFVFISPLEAQMIHQSQVTDTWKVENLPPFDELLLSWNGNRPIDGKYRFYISIKTTEWSPWFLYALWENSGQANILQSIPGGEEKVYKEVVEFIKEKKASGFQIKIVEEGQASLASIRSLHVYINSDVKDVPEQKIDYVLPVYLPVPGLSQMMVNHIRCVDLCSPVSTTAVVRYLSHNYTVDPTKFAECVWDRGCDLFGNWVLNVAQASALLGPKWACWVERLSGFDPIYQKLQQGIPVIVSVRGPLKGSASPYASGHLMAVIGYDPIEEKVICMDPAFISNESTHVFYSLSAFLEAWNRRGRVAYIFSAHPDYD